MRPLRTGLRVADAYQDALGATELRVHRSAEGDPLARLGLRWWTRPSTTTRAESAPASVAATVGPPTDPPDRSEPAPRTDPVRLWPVALLPDQALRSGQADALRLRIRYLVTAGSWGPRGATPLDRLLLAAAADSSVQLVIEPVPDHTWQALGLRPQAALQIELPIRVARTVTPTPRVRAPLRVDGAPLVALRGRVLGPGDIPVPGVRVAAVGLGTATRADGHGEFVLDAVPAVGPTRLLVTGKGLHLDLEVEPSTQPVDLHCELEEV